jgi:hypothetical protein
MGGSIANLWSSRFSGEVALVWALGATVLSSLLGTIPVLRPVVLSLWLVSTVVVVAVAAVNVKQTGFAAVLAGSILNIAVVTINRGMPVSIAAAEQANADPVGLYSALAVGDGLHIAVSAGTVATLLSDVAVVPGPEALRLAVSIGDVLVFVGLLTIVARSMQDVRVWGQSRFW